uniref:tRNA (adenosine(37)-N6)-threonylcarbamoyltransferase complex dimerization subunit type 1 TsaB n=1 Tax=Stappia sp. TaxID=1870903 RepID=UPI003BA9AC4D
MRLLAIDTALEACSVAVLDGEGEAARLTCASELLGRGHAERLMGMIGEVMAEAGTVFSSLDRIVVTTGPGSFTGLRVGLSAARGIALVVGAPAVGVTTLAAMAEQARTLETLSANQFLHVVLAAKGGEVYAQSFSGDGQPLAPPGVETAAGLAARLVPGDRIFGSGATAVLACADPANPPIVLGEAGYPDIVAVARLGARADSDTARPEPVYLRPPDARPAVRDERLLA